MLNTVSQRSRKAKTLKLVRIFTSIDHKYFHTCLGCATLHSCYECVPHKQVTSFLCEPIQVSDSIFFSRAFAVARRAESEVRADRNDVGADRAGAARTFVDAVIACDRLTHTVGGGSVERVVEEVIERGAPIPQHCSAPPCACA